MLSVMNLAHESLRVVNHVGRSETMNRVLVEGSLTVLALYAYLSDSQNAAFGLLVWCI